MPAYAGAVHATRQTSGQQALHPSVTRPDPFSTQTRISPQPKQQDPPSVAQAGAAARARRTCHARPSNACV
ncbi:hypothetical protein GCM10028832_01380 [Streptomyces sparsus]